MVKFKIRRWLQTENHWFNPKLGLWSSTVLWWQQSWNWCHSCDKCSNIL